MNISEVSAQLHMLSDDYSNQIILVDEYRLKRKYLLDEIDQKLNNQTDVNTSYETEKYGAEKPDEMDNVMSDAINNTLDINKNNKDDDTRP